MNTSFKDRVERLRAAMTKAGLAAFILPRAGRFLTENMSEDEERLRWLTGFTGSAGVVIVTMDKAVVMSDGRYTIQLKRQADPAVFTTGDSTKIKIGEWLAANVKEGAVGYDPWLHTPKQIAAIEEALKETKLKLQGVAQNPVDEIWKDQPAAPCARTEIFPKEIAGAGSAEKRALVAAKVKEAGAHAAILSLPDSICWLLNVRGGDVEYAPLVLSYAFIYADGRVDWFIDSHKIGADIRAHVGPDVRLREFEEIENGVAELAQGGKPVLSDASRNPAWFKNKIEQGGAKVLGAKDPCIDFKAIKSVAEQKALQDAHVRDGASVVKFLAWFEKEAPKGKLDEISVAEHLEAFRAKDASFHGPSFATIAGWGANGAVVHYRAEPETNLKIEGSGILLLDSGGQYPDGTTDITRTIAVGKPTDEQKKNFTLVLKGHIAVAKAKIKPGTKGVEVDALARKALKEHGLDYAHGTGHGVGCYLQVHEEAASFSPRGESEVKPGMLISNEPGYYKENEYGIRIESLVLAQEEGGEIVFKTVTQAPIDLNLIDASLLDADEREWLNAYHAGVLKNLEPLLDGETALWLRDNTKKI